MLHAIASKLMSVVSIHLGDPPRISATKPTNGSPIATNVTIAPNNSIGTLRRYPARLTRRMAVEKTPGKSIPTKVFGASGRAGTLWSRSSVT